MRFMTHTLIAGSAVLFAASACGATDSDKASIQLSSAPSTPADQPRLDPVEGETPETPPPTPTTSDEAPYDPFGHEPLEPSAPAPELANLLRNDIKRDAAVGAYCYAMREVSLWRVRAEWTAQASSSNGLSSEKRAHAADLAAQASQSGVADTLASAAARSLAALESATPPKVGSDFHDRLIDEFRYLVRSGRGGTTDAVESAAAIFEERFRDLESWDGAEDFSTLLEAEGPAICE